MALKKQTVVLPFNKGIETKEGLSSVVNGSLQGLQDARFEKTGQIALRYGLKHQTQLDASGTQIGKSYGTAAYKDELISFNGKNAFSTIENSGSYRMIDRGQVSAATFKQDHIASNLNAYQSAPSVAVVGDLAVYAYVEVLMSASGTSYRIMATIKDLDNNTEVVAPTLLASESIVGAGTATGYYTTPSPYALAMGNYVYIVAYQSSAIRYWKIDLTSGTIPTSISTSSTSFGLSLGQAGRVAFSCDTLFTTTHDVGALVIFFVKNNGSGHENEYALAMFTDSGSGVLSLESSTNLFSTGSTPISQHTTGTDSSVNNADPLVSLPVVRCLNTPTGTTTDSSKKNASSRIVVMYTAGGDIRTSVLTQDYTYQHQHVLLKSSSTLIAGSVISQTSIPSTAPFLYVIEHGLSGSSDLATKPTGTNPSGSPLEQKTHGLRKISVASDGTVTRDSADFVTNASLVTDLMHSPNTNQFVNQYPEYVFGVSMHNGNAGYSSSSRTVMVNSAGLPVAASLFGEASSSTSEASLYMAGIGFYSSLAGSNTIYDGARLHYGAQRITHLGDQKYLFGCSKFVANHEFVNTNIMNATTATVDLLPDRYMPSAQAGNSLITAGGLLFHYAGDYFKELGFLFSPTFRSVDPQTSGGSIPAGTYLYQAVFEWQDQHGNLQQSAPSEQVSVTTTHASSNSVDLVIYGLQLTHKRDPKIVLYRTDTGGSQKHKVASKAIDGSMTYSFTDVTGYGLTDNTPLYTDLGELAHVPPGSCTDITVFRNRIFAVGADNAVYFSSTLTPGLSPFFVATSQYFTVDNYAKDITGIENNVETLLVFTEAGVYRVSGEGPDGTGGNGAFTHPKLFAPGQGMEQYKAHANTPIGVMYVSRRGVYLIGRNLQISYIGKSVEDTIGSLEVIKIVSIDAFNEVRFGLSDGDILVYNYAFNTWSETLVTSSNTVRGIEYCQGTFFYVGDYGRVRTEDTSTFVDQVANVGGDDVIDTTTGYSLVVTLNSLRLPEIGNAVRLYRIKLMGNYLEDHTQNMIVFTDQDSSKLSTTGAVAFSTAAGNVSGGYQQTVLRHHVPHQKAASVQVAIQIARSGTSTASSLGIATLDAIAFEIGLRPNATFKQPTERTA